MSLRLIIFSARQPATTHSDQLRLGICLRRDNHLPVLIESSPWVMLKRGAIKKLGVEAVTISYRVAEGRGRTCRRDQR